MRTTRLFVDAHPFDEGYHGTHTFIRELYRELLHYPGLEVYFGSSRPDKIMEAFPGLAPEQVLPYRKQVLPLGRLLVDVPAYLRKYAFDFAHFQNVSVPNNRHCKTVVTLHDVVFNDFPEHFSKLYRHSRHLLFGKSIKEAWLKTTVSEYSRRRIAAHYGIDTGALHVVPNGADNLHTGPSKATAAAYVHDRFGLHNFILNVSRIEPRKNQALLLKVYRQLRLYEQGISLVFIGRSSIDVPAFHTQLQQLTEAERPFVHWLQQVDEQDLPAFYAACKLFVYPSRAEGFGIPPLEAAMCMAPVLCSNATAMESFSFFDPYTFHPDNEDQFKQRLRSALTVPPSTTFLEQAAHSIRTRYSWQQSARTFYHLLNSQPTCESSK